MKRLESRGEFIKKTLLGGAVLSFGWPVMRNAGAEEVSGRKKREFKISLAGWSLHRAVRAKEIAQLDMPKICREEFGIDAVEFVSGMFASRDPGYIAKLIKAAQDNKVFVNLIMVDGFGNLGDRRQERRDRAVKMHSEWVDIAADMGCVCLRANWAGARRGAEKDPETLTGFINRSAGSFGALAEYGAKKNIKIIIENHGGPSSYPDALVRLMKAVDNPYFGTLPDFGNFPADVDRYDAVAKMMPYAKAVSAKCYDFDENGQETRLDYERLLKIVVDDGGYHGYIGIEYEGNRLSEYDGVKACKKLLLNLM